MSLTDDKGRTSARGRTRDDTDQTARDAHEDNSSLASIDQVDLGELNYLLGFMIRKVQLWIFKDLTQALAAYDIRPAQFSALTVIKHNPGINQLSLASALSIERAGAGRLVERLEKRDLVLRAQSEADRRANTLCLTPAGQAMLSEMTEIVKEHDQLLARELGLSTYDKLMLTLAALSPEENGSDAGVEPHAAP